MLTKTKKQKAIKGVQKHVKDTGSTPVQIAILTKEIDELSKHLKKHQGDNHSRRGLLGKVSERQKLLKYLAKNDPKSYKSVLKKVGLK